MSLTKWHTRKPLFPRLVWVNDREPKRNHQMNWRFEHPLRRDSSEFREAPYDSGVSANQADVWQRSPNDLILRHVHGRHNIPDYEFIWQKEQLVASIFASQSLTNTQYFRGDDMIFIWRGWGFLVFALWVVCLLFTEFTVNRSFGHGFYTANEWPKVLAGILSAALIWPIGRLMNAKSERDEFNSGGAKHALFFVPMEYWVQSFWL